MAAAARVLSQSFIKTRIYAQLVELVTAGIFYRFRVDGQTGMPTTAPVVGDRIYPIGINANETESTFVDARNQRSPKLERESISWVLLVDFAEQVIAELFENAVSDQTYTVVPADHGLPQLNFRFERAEYTHPPLQQASTGSRVKFTVSVEVGQS